MVARRAYTGRHRGRPTSCGRVLTVAVSALLTIAVAFVYLVADMFDIVPGLLTVSGVSVPEVPETVQALEAGGLISDADLAASVDEDEAQALIDTFASSDGVGSDYSIIIADGEGNIVAQTSPDTAREPASTIKTLTALAATATLDMASTLDTETYLIQDSDGSATLILKGNGDMLLGSGESDPDHINGRAGLGTLAADTVEQLEELGITSVNLVYDDTLYGDVRSPANISENNSGNYYFTGVAALAVDGGRQWGDSTPDDPDTYSEYPQLSTQPAADAADVFAERLEELGISVEGDIKSGETPDDSMLVASVSSATLKEVMAFMMRHSDNTLAEVFGRLTALAAGYDNSPEGATQAVTETLDSLGVDVTGLNMADCSGLSPGSELTARTLIEVQVTALTSSIGAAMLEGLSIPGLVGTALNRLADEDAAGLLRVKTGSLSSVTSMSGNVSRANGGVLTFAVIVNNPDNSWEAAQAINIFVAALAEL